MSMGTNLTSYHYYFCFSIYVLISILLPTEIMAYVDCERGVPQYIAGYDGDGDGRYSAFKFGCGYPDFEAPWFHANSTIVEDYELDCDDSNPYGGRLTMYWPDADGDYHGDSSEAVILCDDFPQGFIPTYPNVGTYKNVTYYATDCDPSNPNITTNGWRDTDKDGYADYIDEDGESCHEARIDKVGYLSKLKADQVENDCDPNDSNQYINCCPKWTKFDHEKNDCICTIKPIPEIPSSDLATIDYENRKRSLGPNEDPVYFNNETTENAATCVKEKVAERGGFPKITSGFRPAGYQTHLYAVWIAQDFLSFNKDEEFPYQCQSVIENMRYETNLHGPLKKPAREISQHTRGNAFDMTWWRDEYSNIIPFTVPPISIDTIAQSCGVCRPFPGEFEIVNFGPLATRKDGQPYVDEIHFEVISRIQRSKLFGNCH
jgi:hypothetical protein